MMDQRGRYRQSCTVQAPCGTIGRRILFAIILSLLAGSQVCLPTFVAFKGYVDPPPFIRATKGLPTKYWNREA